MPQEACGLCRAPAAELYRIISTGRPNSARCEQSSLRQLVNCLRRFKQWLLAKSGSFPDDLVLLHPSMKCIESLCTGFVCSVGRT
jgi:hypothetical protein